jgi:drug/metabolite transporter (DMT)-like permease
MKGVAAMILAALLLTLNDAVSKYLTETYFVGQVIALRQLRSLVVIIPYIHWISGWGTIRVANRGGMALRALFFIATTGFIVLSFSLLPLALVTAVAFASPIFVVALSRAMIGEHVSRRRWIAVLAGFVGVLIIVRPGGAAFDAVLIWPVLAALAAGFRDVVTRRLSRTDSSISILFWSTLAVIAAASLTAVDGWQAVTPAAAGWLLLNGMLGGSAHFLIIESLRLGDASLVAPFRYTGLIWATILGLLIWGQFPDHWTIVGALVLVVSGIYIIEREAHGRT